ncbi:MAG: 3-deoxy-D-manno-octulosonic acid transferase [Thalassovita sp.]
MTSFPSFRMRLFLLFWGLLWIVALPAILLYIRLRARKDATYGQDLSQRFGLHRHDLRDTIWLHTVSIGEFRSAVPLIRAFLEQGETLVITHFTPAGRRDIHKVFPDQIAEGRIVPVWVPFEYDLSFRMFFKAFRPRFGLVMEVEFWPRMIASARKYGVPLFLCNGQYPSKSYDRDKDQIRGQLVRGFAGVMIKNDVQADRFRALGVGDEAIRMTGEMRFDQPIAPALLTAANTLRDAWPGARPAFTIASAVEGEDDLYLDAIAKMRDQAKQAGQPIPRVVYVPRAPERFDDVAALIQARGWTVARRSEVLDANLGGVVPDDTDILLGDSLGEMYFYLALTDRAVVGGGFTPKGAHNVIEPLALQKPVFVGPEIWTIEYPALDAIKAGVLTQCADAAALAQALGLMAPVPTEAQMTSFFETHSGGVARTLEALPGLLDHARAQGITKR